MPLVRRGVCWVGWLAPLGLYLLTVGLLGRRAVADGYDGVGFRLALRSFDLEHFAPQPPGYPLLVLLGRLLVWLGAAPAVALGLCSAGLLGAGISGLAAAVARRLGRRTGILLALLLTLSPLSWGLGIATLSDGGGLGLVLLAVGLWGRPGRRFLFLSGLLCGLGLGVRPPNAPLVALLLLFAAVAGGWRRVGVGLGGLLVGICGWLIPFSLQIGPGRLLALTLGQLHGHLTLFGGSLLTDRALGERLLALLGGIAEGAFGRLWPLALVCVAWPLRLGGGRPTLPAGAARLLGYALLGLLACGLWALLGLPVRGHGRHLLPAVVALDLGFALWVGGTLLGGDRPVGKRLLGGRLLGGLLLLGLLGGSARSIWALRQPSPGAALADYVVGHYPSGTLLFGGRAARYLDLAWGSGSARPTLYFGDLRLDLERRDHLPKLVLLTSEVQASPQRQLSTVARFCYPPALPTILRFDDLADGCVALLSYRLPE